MAVVTPLCAIEQAFADTLIEKAEDSAFDELCTLYGVPRPRVFDADTWRYALKAAALAPRGTPGQLIEFCCGAFLSYAKQVDITQDPTLPQTLTAVTGTPFTSDHQGRWIQIDGIIYRIESVPTSSTLSLTRWTNNPYWVGANWDLTLSASQERTATLLGFCIEERQVSPIPQFTVAIGRIQAVPKASITDGESFTLSDAMGQTATFEFDTVPDGVTAGNITVDISGDVDEYDVANTMVAAINAQTAINVAAANAGGLFSNIFAWPTEAGPAGNRTDWTEAVSDAGFVIQQPTGGGVDDPLLQPGTYCLVEICLFADGAASVPPHYLQQFKGVLTGGANVADGDTVTMGSKTYTFQTALTNVDGNVLQGVDLEASLLNLYQAISLGSGAGTLYATSTTAHPEVEVSDLTATTLTVRAQANTHEFPVALSETSAVLSWGAALLEPQARPAGQPDAGHIQTNEFSSTDPVNGPYPLYLAGVGFKTLKSIIDPLLASGCRVEIAKRT